MIGNIWSDLMMGYNQVMQFPQRQKETTRSRNFWSKRASFLLALGLVVGVPSAVHGQTSAYDAFPLAKDVPGGSYATLGQGKLRNGTRWGVFASRVSKRPAGRRLPCISVARITRDGRYGNAYRCGPLVPSAESSDPVYVGISGSGQSKPGGPVVGEVVFGMSFSEDVQKVTLDLTDGTTMTKGTRRFNTRQQMKTHLGGFRYLALGFRRDVCVLGVRAFDATGVQVFEGSTGVCSEF